MIHGMATRKCQLGLLLLLGALLLVACATVEAPGRATEQPEAITLGMGPPMGAAAQPFAARIAQLSRC